MSRMVLEARVGCASAHRPMRPATAARRRPTPPQPGPGRGSGTDSAPRGAQGRATILALAVVLAGAGAAELSAQHPNHATGFSPRNTFELGDVEHVNLFNGSLTLTLPIGGEFPVGPELSYGLTLTYSNNAAWMWDERLNDDNEPFLQALPRHQSNAGLGWNLTLGGDLLEAADPLNTSFHPAYVGPDGSIHELTASSLHDGGQTFSGVRFSRDSTYLRFLEASNQVELPDGTLQTYGPHGLERVEDPFGNWVEIAYENPDPDTGHPLRWTLSDVHGRSHTVTLSLRSYGGHLAPTVDAVEIEGFDGETATYGFSYGKLSIVPPCNDPPLESDGDPATNPDTVTVPVLTGVSLPEGLDVTIGQGGYKLDGDLSAPCSEKRTNGFITRLELPTGGRHEWTWMSYGFPLASAERHPLTGQTGGGAPFRVAGGLATRTHVRRNGTTLGTWTYAQELEQAPGTTRTVESQTTVTDPNGHRTLHFFNAFVRDPNQEDPEGWVHGEYGLPFTRRVGDGTTPERFVSRKVFDKNDTHLRSVFVRYEHSDVPTNPRLASRRTLYHDAGGKVADLDLSNFDGLGHYRRSDVSGTFAGTNARTTITNFNPGRSVSDVPGPSEPWILDTFDRRELREGGERFVQEFLFQAGTGHLRRVRTYERKDGTCSGADVIQNRIRFHDDFPGQEPGFPAQEELHGGDGASLPCTELGSIALETAGAAYVRKHRYTCGVLDETFWFEPGVGRLSFNTVDRDVDCPSGLVKVARDTAGLATTFTYDLLGRPKIVTPGAGEAKTKYSYAAEAVGNPDTTAIQRLSATGEVLAGRVVELDGFGRVARELRDLPDGTRAQRRNLWNALGQILDRGQWEPEGEPASERSRTRFRLYDPFGRPEQITLPDGQVISITYNGESSRTIRVPVATSLDASGEPQTEIARTLEVYDRFGRLHEVREPPLPDGTRTRTLYSYDGQGNLTRVDMNSGGSPVQVRRFRYDGRGFLTFETHPELGAPVFYADYDPLGNPGRVHRGTDRTVAGGWDLRYTYDAASRLTRIHEVYDVDGDPATPETATRDWKTWTYATANHQAGRWSNGKLAQAVRHNHVLIPGTNTSFDAAVTEAYEYDGVGGRISRVVTDLASGDPDQNTRPTYDYRLAYDPLGNVASRDYPECSHKFCIDVPDPDRTVSQSFTQGFLTEVPGYASKIAYHPNGLYQSVVHTNGVTDLQERDPDDMTRPLRLQTSGASEDFDSGVYAYDGAGNVTEMGPHRYVYDRLSRVVEARVQVPGEGCGETLALSSGTETGTVLHESCGTIEAGGGYTVGSTGDVTLRAGSRVVLTDGFSVAADGRLEAETDPSLDPENQPTDASQSYALDRFGNLLEATTSREGEADQTRTIGTVSSTNRLSVASYDVAGNVTEWAGREYDWDPFGILQQTKPTNANGVTFVYGPGDERFWAVDWTRGTDPSFWLETWTLRDLDGSVLRQYRTDGGNETGNWSLHRDYVWRGGSLLAAETPEGTKHFHLDHLGSPRLITDASGTTRAEHLYFPFGEEATDPAQDAEVMKFTGHERDDLDSGGTTADLDYMHARFFSAHLGRFLSFDPSSQSASRNIPQSWNKYSYVLNNPLAYIDPYGQRWFKVNGEWLFFKDADVIEQVEVNDEGEAETKQVKGKESVVTFDGGTLTLLKSDGSRVDLSATSGELDASGRTQPDLQSVRDVGPVPEGAYSFEPSAIQRISLVDQLVGTLSLGTRGSWPGGTAAWGKQRVFLDPEPGTETFGRSGFAIHGGATPGSRGCIDLCRQAPDFFSAVERTLNRIYVEVDYPNN